MSRKIMHLENKTTGEHKYYGSLVALLKDTPELPFHTVRRITKFPYERDNYIIREGVMLTPREVEGGKNNG